jgi:hypothetical protein
VADARVRGLVSTHLDARHRPAKGGTSRAARLRRRAAPSWSSGTHRLPPDPRRGRVKRRAAVPPPHRRAGAARSPGPLGAGGERADGGPRRLDYVFLSAAAYEVWRSSCGGELTRARPYNLKWDDALAVPTCKLNVSTIYYSTT